MNLRIVSSPHEEFALSSTVKGQRIFLDARVLASILHIPHTDIYIFEYKNGRKSRAFTLITSCQFSTPMIQIYIQTWHFVQTNSLWIIVFSITLSFINSFLPVVGMLSSLGCKHF
ncbi:hypothetical protein CFOL_v3_02595 [Cephalotus follicularis]|uniref:Uncharacterized protein n=1 Tax=Cephalotus follicularis TaxID=3775 RepID=A0A1Q3AU13_CEPFO|nr:hypothetical protein CFOL_v3_02595 [Cephalotus follicularis]